MKGAMEALRSSKSHPMHDPMQLRWRRAVRDVLGLRQSLVAPVEVSAEKNFAGEQFQGVSEEVDGYCESKVGYIELSDCVHTIGLLVGSMRSKLSERTMV